MSQRCELPPSSSGLGRSPFKATTGVRIPVGAQISKKPLTAVFVYARVCFHGKSECFDYDVDPKMREIGVVWFESLF
jgi:hypothetical protein